MSVYSLLYRNYALFTFVRFCIRIYLSVQICSLLPYLSISIKMRVFRINQKTILMFFFLISFQSTDSNTILCVIRVSSMSCLYETMKIIFHFDDAWIGEYIAVRNITHLVNTH